MLPRDKTIYVAGPMTGLPQFNVPAFDRQTARLRAAGYKVISPVEEDSPELRAIQLTSKTGDVNEIGGSFNGETWGEILARDVKIIADRVDAICVLPNWQKSRGARLEVFVGLLCGKPILEDWNYDQASDQVHVVAMATADVVFTIARSFL